MSRPGVEFSPATRRAIYVRDGFRCARCLRLFPGGRGLDAHHRLLRSQGGMGTLDNGVSLCGSGTTGCHGWVHAHPALSYAAGWMVHGWDDPASVPIQHGLRRDATPREHGEDEPGGDETPQPDLWDHRALEIASERLTEWSTPGVGFPEK